MAATTLELDTLKKLRGAASSAAESAALAEQIEEAMAKLQAAMAVPDLYNAPLFYVLPVLAFQLLMSIATSVYFQI